MSSGIKITLKPSPSVDVLYNNPSTIDVNLALPGPNIIAGFPIYLQSSPSNYDALMFSSGLSAWTNVPQTEIADGGNF